MKLTVKLLSGAIALAFSTCAFAQEDSMFTFSGFGTLGIVHSTEDQADFTPDIQTEEGAGASHSTVIPPPISRRQKWNFLVPFPEEVP
ncbi:hypothetical protein XAC29_19125 [Xanthomonas axonopodis Xac29-1]|nr:hypothetical protein XAC29_19125 [Xanthomonas axonopodis Xac29-1]